MRTYEYKEIKSLFMSIGSKAWADSRMIGRCGISQKRLDKAKELRPDIPTDVLLKPYLYIQKDKK